MALPVAWPGCRAVVAALFLAVALVVCLGAADPAGASSSGELILIGNSNSYIDVQLSSPMKIHGGELAAVTDGTYAGFAVYERSTMQRRVGAVVLPGFAEMGDPFGPYEFTRRTVRLKTGSYRFFLYTDARSEVRIPFEGEGGSLRLRPKKPGDVEAEVVDLQALENLSLGEARIPIDIEGPSDVNLVALGVWDSHQVSAMEACVAEPSGPGCIVSGVPPSTSAVYPGPSVGRGYTSIFAGGSPQPGAWDVLIRTNGAAARAEALLGFYLVHELV